MTTGGSINPTSAIDATICPNLIDFLIAGVRMRSGSI
jgi:hypothetical protein